MYVEIPKILERSVLGLVPSKACHTCSVYHIFATLHILFISLLLIGAFLIHSNHIRMVCISLLVSFYWTLWATLRPSTTLITLVIHASQVPQWIVSYLFVRCFVKFLLQLADSYRAFVIFTPIFLNQDIQLATLFNIRVAYDSRLLRGSRSLAMWLSYFEIWLLWHLHSHLLSYLTVH